MHSSIMPGALRNYVPDKLQALKERQGQRRIVLLSWAVKNNVSSALAQDAIPASEKIAEFFKKSSYNYLAHFAEKIWATRNPNWKDGNGNSILAIAGYHGDITAVKFLLSCKEIYVNEKNNYGSTPFMLVIQEGHISIIKALLENPHFKIDSHNQGQKSLEKTKNPEIRELITQKMQNSTGFGSKIGRFLGF